MAVKQRPNNRGYTENNSVQIIRGGAAYFRSIEEIAASAHYSLHLQTYIFDEDETGQQVARALKAAAQRGVLVYVILDGYASQHLSTGFVADLRKAGVHFRFFEPFFKNRNFYFGRRMHHKVFVADARICLVGGVNVSNRYNDLEDRPAWLDWALLAEGAIAEHVDRVCVRMWNRSVFSAKCLAVKPPKLPPPDGHCLVRVSRNDWVYKRTDITNSYRAMFAVARSEITIMTSYFWPPRRLLRRMEVAARRGVAVRVVLTGNADVPFAKYAERYLYNRLFRSNIEVYEYRSNVLHGKIAIRDREWLTVGSYNLNNISAFASVELNLDVDNAAVAVQLDDAVAQIIGDECTKVTKADFEAANSPLQFFFYYLSFRIVQALFFLFTFYFSQKRKR